MFLVKWSRKPDEKIRRTLLLTQSRIDKSVHVVENIRPYSCHDKIDTQTRQPFINLVNPNRCQNNNNNKNPHQLPSEFCMKFGLFCTEDQVQTFEADCYSLIIHNGNSTDEKTSAATLPAGPSASTAILGGTKPPKRPLWLQSTAPRGWVHGIDFGVWCVKNLWQYFYMLLQDFFTETLFSPTASPAPSQRWRRISD